MQEAQFYKKLESGSVQCDLCPWNCQLKSGQTGICKVRTNENGKLFTSVYNKVASLGSDPIEKKPLYHFYPGKNILSVGEVGCNLQCSFCQNHRISQCYASEFNGFHNITSKRIVKEALKTCNNIGIAYTYNEPVTFYEFLLETAQLAHKNGLKNVVVSNGYINTKPLLELIPFIDAFNIDLKAFSNSFYQQYTKGKLEPVLDSLKIIAKNNTHLEVTNLIITSLNDNESEFEKMIIWIATKLGEHIPLHLSRYFPQYKMHYPPTPVGKLNTLYNIAKQYLQHVYLGNVSDKKRSSTFCFNCGEILIERHGYQIDLHQITPGGNCKKCGTPTHINI
ncbi:AmmeMemoRadiSam system radical SAM enzyme [Draconibacterium sp.]|nr:AmmeMemoRadiSam system radical SAM enzyme [Draconibacterium sp.]